MDFRSYLESMLNKEQLNNLRFALNHDLRVHFYGSGLGKSELANLLKKEGFDNVSESGDDSNPGLGMWFIPDNVIAIEFKKDTFENPLSAHAWEIFEGTEIRNWILRV